MVSIRLRSSSVYPLQNTEVLEVNAVCVEKSRWYVTRLEISHLWLSKLKRIRQLQDTLQLMVDSQSVITSSPLWDTWPYFINVLRSDHCGGNSHTVPYDGSTGLSVLHSSCHHCHCLVHKSFDNINNFYKVSYINIHLVKSLSELRAEPEYKDS
jgi:hypothetical protein